MHGGFGSEFLRQSEADPIFRLFRERMENGDADFVAG
jgi:hypothetical protein